MHLGLPNLIPIIIHYRYWIIFPIAAVEGPVLTIICGFLSSLHYVDFKVVYLVLVAGDLLGDVLVYYAGRKIPKSFILKHGHWIGIDPERLVKMEKLIHGNLKKIFVFGKFAHGLGYFTWFATGVVRVPFGKFLFANTITTAIKSMLLLTIGYFFGQAYVTFNTYFSYSSYILLILFILAYVIAIKTDLFGKILEKIEND